jgi:DNA repair protein RecN (Recombination protein N)
VLEEIRIAGLGVIDEAVLALHPGLTVLTGETGAGKTMVVQGLGLLLGSRADAGLVRTGRAVTEVEGILTLPEGHPGRERAQEAGGRLDGDELVLARTVSGDGRSRAYVGGRSAPVGVLAEIGERVVAVHGQADQWRLRRPDQHRAVLDGYGGAALAGARAAYLQAYAAWRAACDERDRLRALERDRAREVDSLTAALEQIERVDPESGEDQALREEDERLAHAEGLRQSAAQAHALLTGEDATAGLDDSGVGGPGAAGSLAQARGALAQLSRHDPRLAALESRVADAAYLVADLGADLAGYLADLDVDPTRLAWVQARRADLGALTRRYGDTVDDVLAWSRASAQRLAELLATDDRLASLDGQVAGLETELQVAATRLSAARREAAVRFEQALEAELAHLALGSAHLRVALTTRDPGPHGADEVEIQWAANVGSPARPVTKAASGGELSRLMLAIEVVTGAGGGAGEHVPTFVFDEVDAGVGGAAALDVGARLAALARHAQVVVVTHLAQVAAYADRHLVVRKDDDGSVTASAVTEVTADDRLRELARMMGGGSSPEGLEHARVLLTRAQEQREGAAQVDPGHAAAPVGRNMARRRAEAQAGARKRTPDMP